MLWRRHRNTQGIGSVAPPSPQSSRSGLPCTSQDVPRYTVVVSDHSQTTPGAVMARPFNPTASPPRLALQVAVGIFLHSAFPSSEIFRAFPKREELLRSLLNADVIGFHTFDYARHFISCCSRMLGLEHYTKRGSILMNYYGRAVHLKILPTCASLPTLLQPPEPGTRPPVASPARSAQWATAAPLQPPDMRVTHPRPWFTRGCALAPRSTSLCPTARLHLSRLTIPA